MTTAQVNSGTGTNGTGQPRREGAVDARFQFNKRFNDMRTEYVSSWQPIQKELSRFQNPKRGFFDGDLPNQGKKIDHRTLIDSHARRCIRTLASGMTSGLTSPSRPWFDIGVRQTGIADITEVKIWCDDVRNKMLDIFAGSNIYGSLHIAYEEIATFGNTAMLIEEDFKTVIRAHAYTVGQYYFGCDSSGRVNRFAREFWLTVDQLVEKFGFKNCSATVQASWQNNEGGKWIKVRHLIEPNDSRIPGIKDNKNMPYSSIYWEDASQEKEFLRWSGYEEFPILGPRWDQTTTADAYGNGPGWDALGDTKMLQKEQKEKLQSIDLVNRPPMQADASVEGDVNTLPGGVTRSSLMVPNGGVRPAYQIRPDLNAIREDIREVKQAISETFYADLFLMLINADTARMTATEVAERQSEKLQILGPVLERLESELLNPLIERTFQIMLRNGLIPPPPKQMQGAELKVKYISVLAQAQKMVGVTALQQQLGMVGNMATIAPEVKDIINWDEAARESADMLNIPAKIINSPERVAQIRKQREEAAAAAAQQQQMLAGVSAMREGAGAIKDLGNTPVGENSALRATLGAITGSQ